MRTYSSLGQLRAFLKDEESKDISLTRGLNASMWAPRASGIPKRPEQTFNPMHNVSLYFAIVEAEHDFLSIQKDGLGDAPQGVSEESIKCSADSEAVSSLSIWTTNDDGIVS